MLPVVSKQDDDKARKEWRRQATAVINNAKFHKAVTRLLVFNKVDMSIKIFWETKMSLMFNRVFSLSTYIVLTIGIL